MIKAIETDYAGCRFRSRLEADFAAHLDMFGYHWEYEQEAFELSNGTKYLPDFYLPLIDAYIEVKGSHGQRIDKFERFAADLWDEMEPDVWGERTTLADNAPLCILATADYAPAWSAVGLLPEARGRGAAFIGVQGPGNRYSVFTAICSACNQYTITVLGKTNCRICGTAPKDNMSWFESWLQTGAQKNWNLTKAPVKRWVPKRVAL